MKAEREIVLQGGVGDGQKFTIPADWKSFDMPAPQQGGDLFAKQQYIPAGRRDREGIEIWKVY